MPKCSLLIKVFCLISVFCVIDLAGQFCTNLAPVARQIKSMTASPYVNKEMPDWTQCKECDLFCKCIWKNTMHLWYFERICIWLGFPTHFLGFLSQTLIHSWLCEQRMSAKTWPYQIFFWVSLSMDLNKDLHYKRERPSYFRHLISILINSCSVQGRSDPFPQINYKIKPNKTGLKPFEPWYVLN